MANQAIATLDQVINDPNALVQANDASMSKAQVLVMLAQLNGNASDGYQKALDAYRLVKRKADLIPAQQARLEQLRDIAQKVAQQNAMNHTSGGTDQVALLIAREQGKLDSLQAADSPEPDHRGAHRHRAGATSISWEPDRQRRKPTSRAPFCIAWSITQS